MTETKSSREVAGAASVMAVSSREVTGATSVVAESSRVTTGSASVMAESSREVTGAESVKEEPTCPDIDQPLEQTEQDGHYNNDKEKKKMEKNGGLRPGRKWPQYLAANLGKRLFIYHTYVQVSDHIQNFIT
jgi:hypothetical protein